MEEDLAEEAAEAEEEDGKKIYENIQIYRNNFKYYPNYLFDIFFI